MKTANGKCLCGRPATHRVQVRASGSLRGSAFKWFRGCVEHVGRVAATDAAVVETDGAVVGESLEDAP